MDPVPAVGQHTQAILRQLGRSEADIAALSAAGAIETWKPQLTALISAGDAHEH
jgi:hypothetical protein